SRKSPYSVGRASREKLWQVWPLPPALPVVHTQSQSGGLDKSHTLGWPGLTRLCKLGQGFNTFCGTLTGHCRGRERGFSPTTERGAEAAPGFEPGNGGFADLCLTTWLCRRRLQSG